MLKKYSVTIRGHRTSLTLEPDFWKGLQDIAARRNQSMAALITSVDNKRTETQNLCLLCVYVCGMMCVRN